MTVPVRGDSVAEANETFAILLSAPAGARISDDMGLGVIMNDD